jgi:hypothetical protein
VTKLFSVMDDEPSVPGGVSVLCALSADTAHVGVDERMGSTGKKQSVIPERHPDLPSLHRRSTDT